MKLSAGQPSRAIPSTSLLAAGALALHAHEPRERVIWQADFSTIAFTRASVASDLHYLVDTPTAVGGVAAHYAVDTPRIVNVGGESGLLFWGSATNLHTNNDPRSWAGAPSSGTTTLDNATADPVGIMVCYRGTANSGGVGRYESIGTYFTTGDRGNCVTFHAWLKGSGNAQVMYYDGTRFTCRALALGGTWEHVRHNAGREHRYALAGRGFTLSWWDGANRSAYEGGAAAAARDYRLAYPMAERGRRASPWIGAGATSAGEHAEVAASSIVRGGRVRIEMTWAALYDWMHLPHSPRVWTHSAGPYVEIDQHSRRLVIYDGAQTIWVGAPIMPAEGEQVVLRLDVGNGPTTGTITVGSERTIVINDPRDLAEIPSTGTIDLACSGTAQQIEGHHRLWRAFDRSMWTTFHADDVASLLAALGAARGRTHPRVLLAAGTYALTSAIALDATHSGIAIGPQPGAAVTLDGGEEIEGSWSGPDGSGVYSIAYASRPMRLWIDGVACERARSTDLDPAWLWNGDGTVTAPSGAAAAKVGLDGVIVADTTDLWRLHRCRVASITDATITLNEDDFLNTQTMAPAFDPDRVRWAEGSGFRGDAAGYFWADGETLYVRPPAGKVPGTHPVVAPVATQLLTIDGDAGTPATDITIAGITIQHTDAPELEAMAVYQDGVFNDLSADGGYIHARAAIETTYAHGLTITGCTLRRTGSGAVRLGRGAQFSSVVDCTIDDTGSSAVKLGLVTNYDDDPSPALAASKALGNAVANCTISNAGKINLGCAVVGGFYVARTVVSNNTFDDTVPLDAVALGWGWGISWPAEASPDPPVQDVQDGNVVAANYIAGFCRRLGDGGGVYFNGKHDHDGTRSAVFDNYIADAGGADTTECQPYYMDNNADGADGHNNVFDGPRGVLYAKFQAEPITAQDCAFAGNRTTGGTFSKPASVWLYGTISGALDADALAVKAAAGVRT